MDLPCYLFVGIPPVMTGQEITNTEDYLTMATYLTEVYNNFKGEIPHIKHPKLVSTAMFHVYSGK